MSDARADLALELFHKAYSHQMEGDLDLAVDLYQQSIRLHPTAEAHTFLGWTYRFQGKLEDAIKQCKKAIEVDPSFGNPYNDIGAYLIQKGELDQAIPWLERALKAPRYESYCYPHLNLGRVYEARRDWLRAREEYRKAIAENPDYTPARQGFVRIQGFLN